MLIPRVGTQRAQAFLSPFAPSAEDTAMRGDDVQQAAMFSYIGCLKKVGLLRKTWYHAVARVGLDIHLCRGCIQRGSQEDAGRSNVSQSRSPDAGRPLHPAYYPARGSLHAVVKLHSDGCLTYLPAPLFS